MNVNSPKFVKKVFNFQKLDYEKKDKLTGQYAHIINDKLYYQVYTRYLKKSWKDIGVAVSFFNKDKLKFKREMNNINFNFLGKNNIILMEGGAMCNWRVFMDKNNKYKAVGGYHTNNSNHSNCDKCHKLKEFEYYEACWPKVCSKILDDSIEHKCKLNGLYIFESNDGIKWKLYHKKPILSKLSISELSKGSGPHFDTLPSIFYDTIDNKYCLYLRANIRLGARHCMLFRKL